ncbi:hypothetical protein BGW39_004694 [Mortierella sp. 14UC]|nr:hypothetical protein BGW39_004694 [Mortierella sp. 14UC]
MKSATFIAATVALSAIAVSAQTDEGHLYYSSPVSSTVWTTGKNETIFWTNACKPGNNDDLSIVRVPGVRSLETLNCLMSKSATVVIPNHVTTGNTYSLHIDTVPLQSYSAQFTINGVTPPPTLSPSTTGALGGEGEGEGGNVAPPTTATGDVVASTTTADVVPPIVSEVADKHGETPAASVKRSFSASSLSPSFRSLSK